VSRRGALAALALAACGGGKHAPAPPAEPTLIKGDAPPRLYLANPGAPAGAPAGGAYLAYCDGPAEELTVVDQDGVVALARPAGGGTHGECSAWTFDDNYATTREVRTGAVELVLQCRPGVDEVTCAAARDKFWGSLNVRCPDDTCDAAGNPSCFYTGAGCAGRGAAYDVWYQRRWVDRLAASKLVDFGFQQTLVVQGLTLSAKARAVDAAAVAWTTAPAGRKPYLAVDADGDGQADVVTDTMFAAAEGSRAYDTWVRAERCADLAHGGWCRVAHETIVLCDDHE
jgi:hypothetical protein